MLTHLTFSPKAEEIISVLTASLKSDSSSDDTFINMISIANDFQTSQSDSLEPKKQLLREIIETIMWELDSVRQGRWENINNFSQKKRDLRERLPAYDWNWDHAENQDAELHMLHSQIVELENQLKRAIDGQMDVVRAQIDDIKNRSSRLRKTLETYLKNS